MTQKSESSFEEDDFVVYPTHGVGRILGTEKREVAGITLEMLVVRFEHDRMTLRVPLEKARSLGLRTLSSKKQMEQAITTLQGKAKVRRAMWSRRAQEYETKIKSGDPVSIAEVVRDLHRRTNQSEQSYSERQMYQAALERICPSTLSSCPAPQPLHGLTPEFGRDPVHSTRYGRWRQSGRGMPYCQRDARCVQGPAAARCPRMDKGRGEVQPCSPYLP